MNTMIGHPRYYCLAWLFEGDMSAKDGEFWRLKTLRALRSIMEDGTTLNRVQHCLPFSVPDSVIFAVSDSSCT